MNDKKMTYAQQFAEVNSTLCATAASAKAAPHKGGTVPMKTLLTRWGVEGSLYASMSTDSIYKCIGLGEVRCIAGFARKEILADGYGTAKDCRWLVNDIVEKYLEELPYTKEQYEACMKEEIKVEDFDRRAEDEGDSDDKEEEYDEDKGREWDPSYGDTRNMQSLECDGCRCLMGFAPRGTIDYCRTCMAIRHADNERAKKQDLQKRQELGDSLMKHGKEMIHIKDMTAKEMGVMLQGIIATKRAATAAKSAATKAAKKAGK